MVYSPPYSSTEGLVAVGACFDGTDGLPAHKSIGRARGLLIGSSGLFEALITIQPAAQLRSSSTPSLDMRLSRKIQGGPHTVQIFGRYPEFSCKICLQIKLHFSLNVFHTVYNALQVYLRAVWMPLQRQAQVYVYLKIHISAPPRIILFAVCDTLWQSVPVCTSLCLSVVIIGSVWYSVTVSYSQ